MDILNIRDRIINGGLRVTPQRLAVLEAIITLNNHPTADNIIEYIKASYPNIAVGTVYSILDKFVKNKVIHRIETDRDVMRYDARNEKHCHLYCTATERIEDYFDDDLCSVLDNYFRKKNIPDFNIEDIKIQISGKFI